MTPEPPLLPMAPDGCTLDEFDLPAQLDRYRQLSAAVEHIGWDATGARVKFNQTVDQALLGEAIETERGCCSFFALDYAPSERVLSITVDPGRAEALGVVLAALDPAALPGR